MPIAPEPTIKIDLGSWFIFNMSSEFKINLPSRLSDARSFGFEPVAKIISLTV